MTLRPVPDGGLHSVRGFQQQGGHVGVKKKYPDVGLVASDRPCHVAATYTTNVVQAACVTVTRRHVAHGRVRGIVANSGCANACTGEQGMRDAERMADIAARAIGVRAEEILVASTGVIGRYLPMGLLEEGIPTVAATLDRAEPGAFARAIMTTDTVPKESCFEVELGGTVVRIAGVAKGAGMIHPNMATMLAFLVTDAAVADAWLRATWSRVVARTFNMISVDGDTSTNDMAIVLANGAAGNPVVGPGSPHAPLLEEALEAVARDLALRIVRDGEGARTLIETRVVNARSEAEAAAAARAVTRSNLVKTAVHGKDPNWGRIFAAAGYSGARFDAGKADLFIGTDSSRAKVVENGMPVEGIDYADISRWMGTEKVVFVVDLKAGGASATAWGCDMSEEYVKINASYTT